MSVCVKINGKKRTLCAGALDRVITLENRAITVTPNNVDFVETFSAPVEVAAAIETSRGSTLFDGVNVEQVITHKFYIRYDSSVTAETWILFESKRYDIVDVENLEERSQWMLLRCNQKGLSAKAATSV